MLKPFSIRPVGQKICRISKVPEIYSQSTRMMCIQDGGVKLSVVNEVGKEAVVAILGQGDFFGEACLVGQPRRVSTAATITSSSILVMERPEMIRLLHAEGAFRDRFIKHLLSRNTRIEEDLVDQLFNAAEKRLARTLLRLAGYGKQEKPERMIPGISQEILAEMIGTTRARVSFFMNKFRELGFIDYDGRPPWLQINESFLNFLRD